MKRKLLAVLLVLVMALSVMPLAASATVTDPCANGHTWGTDYTYSTDTHTRKCTVCGQGETSMHIFANNTCTVCGVVRGSAVDPSRCDHVMSFIEYNDTQHHYRCDCGQQEYWEDHKDDNGDGVCDDFNCTHGAQNCPHTNTAYGYNMNYHYKQCLSCRAVLIREEAHPITGCDICGYKPCTGEHTFGTGFDVHVCQLCGYYTECIDDNLDCVCDVCGEDYIHYSGDFIYSYDDTYHWEHCDVCGKDYWTMKHFDNNNDGLCDACNYNKSTGTIVNPNPSTPTPPSSGSSDPRLDNVPKTGDISVYFLAAALTLFATTAALTVKKYAF